MWFKTALHFLLLSTGHFVSFLGGRVCMWNQKENCLKKSCHPQAAALCPLRNSVLLPGCALSGPLSANVPPNEHEMNVPCPETESKQGTSFRKSICLFAHCVSLHKLHSQKLTHHGTKGWSWGQATEPKELEDLTCQFLKETRRKQSSTSWLQLPLSPVCSLYPSGPEAAPRAGFATVSCRVDHISIR